MAILRAGVYFFEEAWTSLWRSRLLNALSIATIAVSLFVLGAFLSVASNLSEVVARWTQKVQVTFYLEDGLGPTIRESLVDQLKGDPAVSAVSFVSREEALARFRALFKDLATLPEELGENPFPAAVEATLRPGHQTADEVLRVVHAYEKAPGVEEAQYDLIWIQRLGTAASLVRGVGAFLGGILVLAGVFTISNVIRLTLYARQDEIDIMRLVGATTAYVKGPFVVEGMVLGGLGGGLAVALLWGAARFVTRDLLAASDLLGRAVVPLPFHIGLALVVGGMAVGVLGSLLSLGRSQV